MDNSKIGFDLIQIGLFAILYQVITVTLKKGLQSFIITYNQTHQICSIRTSSIIILPFFLMIQAVWLIQLAFQGNTLFWLNPFFYVLLAIFSLFWAIAQFLVFPKLMNSLNNFLETKKEKELMSLCRQLISLIFLFVIAILFVVKFQQKMIN